MRNKGKENEVNSDSRVNGDELEEGELPQEVKEEDEVDQLESDEEEGEMTSRTLLDTPSITSREPSRRLTTSPQSSSPLTYSQPLTLEQAPPSPFISAAFPRPLKTESTPLSDIASCEGQDQAQSNIACHEVRQESIMGEDAGKLLDSNDVAAISVPPPFVPPTFIAIPAVPPVPTPIMISPSLQASLLTSLSHRSPLSGPTTRIRLPKIQPKIRFSKPPPPPNSSDPSPQTQIPLTLGSATPVLETSKLLVPASASTARWEHGVSPFDRLSEGPPPSNRRHSITITTQISTPPLSLGNTPGPVNSPKLDVDSRQIQSVAKKTAYEVQHADPASSRTVYGRGEEPEARGGRRIYSVPSSPQISFPPPTPAISLPQTSFSTPNLTAHSGSLNQIRPSPTTQTQTYPPQATTAPVHTSLFIQTSFPPHITPYFVLQLAQMTTEYGYNVALQAFRELASRKNMLNLPLNDIGGNKRFADHWHAQVIQWCVQGRILEWNQDRFYPGSSWEEFEFKTEQALGNDPRTGMVSTHSGGGGAGGIVSAPGYRRDQVSNPTQHRQLTTSSRTDTSRQPIPLHPGMTREPSVQSNTGYHKETGFRGAPQQQYPWSDQSRRQANVNMQVGRQDNPNPPANQIVSGGQSNSPALPNPAPYQPASSSLAVMPPFVPHHFRPDNPSYPPTPNHPQPQSNQTASRNTLVQVLSNTSSQPQAAFPEIHGAASAPGNFGTHPSPLTIPVPSIPPPPRQMMSADAIARLQDEQDVQAAIVALKQAEQHLAQLREAAAARDRIQKAQLHASAMEREKKAQEELTKEARRKEMALEAQRDFLLVQATTVYARRVREKQQLMKVAEDKANEIRKCRQKWEADEGERLKAQALLSAAIAQEQEKEMRERDLKLEEERREQVRVEKERREAKLRLEEEKREAELRMEQEKESLLLWEKSFASWSAFSGFLGQKTVDKIDKDFQEREKKIL